MHLVTKIVGFTLLSVIFNRTYNYSLKNFIGIMS